MSTEARGAREWRGLGPRDPMNPTNKHDYDKLPDSSPCLNCAFFAGLEWLNGDISMRVFCESSWVKVSTLIVFYADKKGGGSVGDGQCFNTREGYEGAGTRFGGS